MLTTCQTSDPYIHRSMQNFIKPNIETLAQNNTATETDQPELSIENTSTEDVPHL